ncbi:MAG: leucyl aminopeptidase [bacterium]
MDFEFTQSTTPEVDTLAVLCPAGDSPLRHAILDDYDRALDGHLVQEIDRASFCGKARQRLVLHSLGKLPFDRVLLQGVGAAEELSPEEWLRLGEALGEAAAQNRWQTLAVLTLGLQRQLNEHLELVVRGLLLGGYRFDRHRGKEDGESVPLASLCFISDPPPNDTVQARLTLTPALAQAVTLARDLVNEPAGELTPTALARRAEQLAVDAGLECEILDSEACAQQKLALYLAVARGSDEPPQFIHLTHRPAAAPKSPVLALVGKGITFDSGGLSLKPTASMKDMKCDMAGGATVLAAMSLLPRWNIPFEVHGIVPACENMPSGHAYRVGDVVHGLNGPSVEVVNTDAEGRLILADAISFARKIGCTHIIDLATLTGACLVALGPEVAGVLSNSERLCESFLEAAERAGEAVWQLPLRSRLDEQLTSQVADCKNAGGRYGGTITAALFLKKFVGQTPWVHVDLAGPAYLEKAQPGRPAGGTGFGVATLLTLLAEWPADA